MLFLGILVLSGCKTVETATQPAVLELRLVTQETSVLKIVIFERDGWKEVLPGKQNTYTVKIPLMQGGYSQFLFFKYNQHNPQDYEIIGLEQAGKIIKTFSLKELQNLPEKEGVKEIKH